MGVGQTLGRYTLLRRLAGGGMGEVFLAAPSRKGGVSAPVALKVLRRELAADPSFVQMAIDEARISMFLTHPNIVSVLDFAEERGAYYIAMEYVHGPTVERLVDELRRLGRQLDLAVAIHVGVELLRALKYAHACVNHAGEPLHIVHRDVTPANVLLSAHGEVKLTDFGIARAKGRLHETQAGVVKGKFGYLAPEVTRYERIDARADLFSAGVLLFHLFAARHPVQGASVMEAIFRFEEKRIPKPSDFNPALPPELDKLVIRALEPNPDDRYPTADAMIDALQAVALANSELRKRLSQGAQLLAGVVLELFPEFAQDALESAAREGPSAWDGGIDPGVKQSEYAERATRIVSDPSAVRPAPVAVAAEPTEPTSGFGEKTTIDPALAVRTANGQEPTAVEPAAAGGAFGGETEADLPRLPEGAGFGDRTRVDSRGRGFGDATVVDEPTPAAVLRFGDRTEAGGPGFGGPTVTGGEGFGGPTEHGFGGRTASYADDLLPRLVDASMPSDVLRAAAVEVPAEDTGLIAERGVVAEPVSVRRTAEPPSAITDPARSAPPREARAPSALATESEAAPARPPPRDKLRTEPAAPADATPPERRSAAAAPIGPDDTEPRSSLVPDRGRARPPERRAASAVDRPGAAVPGDYALLVGAPLAEPLDGGRASSGVAPTYVRAPAEGSAPPPRGASGFGADTAKWMSGQAAASELSWSDEDAARRAVATRNTPPSPEALRAPARSSSSLLAPDTLPAGTRASMGDQSRSQVTPTPLVSLRQVDPRAATQRPAAPAAKGPPRWVFGLFTLIALALGTGAGLALYPRFLRPVLRIETVPPGAALWIDGSATLDPTPAEVAVDPGTAHELEVGLEGYQTEKRSLLPLGRGEVQHLEVRLAQIVPEIVVRPPAGARVVLNGREIGGGPLTRLHKLDPAEPVELRVEAPGHVPQTLKYPRGTKVPARVEVELVPAP